VQGAHRNPFLKVMFLTQSEIRLTHLMAYIGYLFFRRD
jgi:hypothetical protein